MKWEAMIAGHRLWPSVKRIELMLSTVGPNNMTCGAIVSS